MNEIATLRVHGSGPVRLLFLDDQDVAAPIAEDGRLHIEMLPVRHTVVVGNANAPNERYAPMTFEAEPGKVYRVVFVDGEPRIYEVDRGRDVLVRDVTQTPAIEPGLPPPPAPPSPPPAGTAPSDAD
jgi:hypothetical protein